VVKYDGVTGEEQLLCQDYAATLCGVHRYPRCCRKIFTAVRQPWLTVDKPATAEIPCCLYAIDRHTETALPQSLRGHPGEQFSQALAFSLSALEVFGAQLYEPMRHAEFFNREVASPDGKPSAAGQSFASLELGGQGERENSGPLLEVNA